MTVLLWLRAVAAVLAHPAEPIGNAAEWIRTEDYPAAALQAGTVGVTGLVMQVSTDGYVRACTVTSSSGSELLDDLSCNLLKLRARYSPARDTLGRPIETAVSQHIRWRLPDDPDRSEPTIAPFSVIVKFDIAPDGTVDKCRVIRRGDVPDDMNPCADISARYLPSRASGRSQPARRVTVTTTVRVDEVGVGDVLPVDSE